MKGKKVPLKVSQFERSELRVSPLRSTLLFTSSLLPSSLLSKGARASDHHSQPLSITMVQHHAGGGEEGKRNHKTDQMRHALWKHGDAEQNTNEPE